MTSHIVEKVFRPRTLTGSALKSVAMHMKAKARAGCAVHLEVKEATFSRPGLSRCPCCPETFSSPARAWEHIATAVDQDHHRLHMEDVRIPRPNQPQRRRRSVFDTLCHVALISTGFLQLFPTRSYYRAESHAPPLSSSPCQIPTIG